MELKIMAFVISVPIPIPFPIPMPRFQCRGLQIAENNLYGHAMCTFLPTGGVKWIDPKEFDFNKCTSNVSKVCVLEVNLEYPKNYVSCMMIML